MGIIEQLVERLGRLEHELSELRTVPTEPAAVRGDGAMRLIDAVKFSGLSRNELYSLMNSGSLPFFCTGRHRVVPRRWLVQHLEYARGMLAEVSGPLEQWLAMARPALAGWPVERVAVTDAPGLTLAVERIAGGWRMEARLRLGGRRVPLSRHVVPSAMSNAPVLADGPAEWWVEERFGDRAALVEGVVPASRGLAADLRQIAGDRWPSPPRKRR